MKTVITSGLSEERKKEIRQEFVGSAALRGRLSEIASNKIKTSHDKSVSEESYDSPNWALKQADARGYERALKEFISLIQ